MLIFAVVFVLFYLCHTPQTLPIGFAGVILLAVGLQPANVELYSPIMLTNLVMTLLFVPFAFVAVVSIIFPNTPARVRRHLVRGTDDLLRKADRAVIPVQDFLCQNTGLLADYGGDLDLADADNCHLVRRNRSAVLVGIELYAIRESDGGILPDAYRRLTQATCRAARKDRNHDPDPEVAQIRQLEDEVLETCRRRHPGTISFVYPSF